MKNNPFENLELDSSAPYAFYKDGWQAIAYNCTLKYKGKAIHTFEYKLGIGHVKVTSPLNSMALTTEERRFLEAWHAKPHAYFKDKELQTRVAARLAKIQKVKPALNDVLHSLLSDGAPYFDSELFPDWCDNYGYSDDSIQAKKTYDLCLETGMMLQRGLGLELINELREALEDY